MFDFFDYNFSSLISIFAALMGMAYPLILQAIQRIDEMYGSTKLAGYFEKQWYFRMFTWFLLVAIVVSIVTPFLLHYYRDYSILIVVSLIHTLVVFALAISAFILFKYILMTTKPMTYLKYLTCQTYGNHPPLTGMFQILKYASDKEDDELYTEASVSIGSYLYDYRRSANSMNNVKGQVTTEVWTMLRELLKQHSKRDNHFFSSRDLISTYFLPMYERIDITDAEFRYIWQTLDAKVHVNDDSWMYSYWTFADQYYRFTLDRYYEIDKVLEWQQERFLEQHFMVGALLVYNGKYELLNKLMYFSNTEPRQYALVPSTFILIHSQLRKLLSYKGDLMLMTQRYNMIGAPQDVSSDDFILRYAYKYSALLLIRLFTLKNLNFTYNDPMSLPPISDLKTVEKLGAEIYMINRLKGEVSEWFKEQNDLEIAIGSIAVAVDDVLNLCRNYIVQCESKIEALNASTEVDPEKREYLKSHLLKALSRYALTIPSRNESPGDGYNRYPIPNSLKYSIDKDILKVGTSINASNLPDLIVENMNEMVYKAYNSVFLLHSGVRNVRIAYKDIKRVFDILNVGQDNAIVSLGVYLDDYESLCGRERDVKFVKKGILMLYRGCEMYSVPSSQQSIIILQKSDLPFIMKANLDDDHGLQLVNSEESFYSNIDEIKDLSENEKQDLCVDRGIYLYAKTIFRYIRLNVEHNSGFVTDMAKVREIREIAWPN